MNKVIVAILVIGVVGLGFWAMTQKAESPVIMENGTDSTWASVSFACADSTYFVAQFPEDMGKVDIIVDGTIVRSLPKVAGAGQRYEDAAYAYVFAGEEVSVTNKASQKITTCSQPMDQNNAPFNFGDMGEGGGEKQDLVLIVSESIVGKYQSTDDAKFTREFKSDATVVDMYDGKVVSSGTWKVFSKGSPLAVAFPIEPSAAYVQLKMSGSQSDTLNFKIGKLTPEELELVYMERGGVLNFKAL